MACMKGLNWVDLFLFYLLYNETVPLPKHNIINHLKRFLSWSLHNERVHFNLHLSLLPMPKPPSCNPLAKLLSRWNNWIIKVFTTSLSYLIIWKCIVLRQTGLTWISLKSMTTDFDSLLKYLLSRFLKETQKQIRVSHIFTFRNIRVRLSRGSEDSLLHSFAPYYMKSPTRLSAPLCDSANELFTLVKCWLIELSPAAQ